VCGRRARIGRQHALALADRLVGFPLLQVFGGGAQLRALLIGTRGLRSSDDRSKEGNRNQEPRHR